MPVTEKGLEERVAILEERFGAYASREWTRNLVQEVTRPMQDAITQIAGVVDKLSIKANGLFDAHSALLKDKYDADKKALDERTPLGLIKKYGPLVTTVGGLIAMYRVLGSLAEAWLKAHGY